MQREQDRPITIQPERVFRLLASMAALLSILNLAVQLVRYRFSGLLPASLLNLFDVNREANFPTLFAVSLLVVAALLLYLVAAAARRQARPFARHWAALAAIFAYLAVDEFVQIHELVSALMARSLAITDVRAFYLWVPPFLLLAAILALPFLSFLRHLPAALCLRLIVAGGLFVGGAIGLELVAALHATVFGIENMPHALIYTAEEFLEMMGVIVLIWALLSYLGELGGAYDLRVVVAPAPARLPGWLQRSR